MAIVTSCPRCRADIRLSSSQSGKTLRCKRCDATFTTVTDEDEAAVRSAARRRQEDDRAARSSARRRGERDVRHGPANDGGGYPWVKLTLACLVFFLLIGGVWFYAIVSSKPAEAKSREDKEAESLAAPVRPDTAPAAGSTVSAVPQGLPHTHPNIPQVAAPAPQPQHNNPDPHDLNGAVAMLRENNAARVKAALKWLASARVEDARRDEVAEALNGPIGAHRRDAMPAAVKWATKANKEKLLPCMDDSDAATRRRAMEALAKIDDPECVEAVVKQFSKQGREADAAKALKAAPPRVAEKFVVKHLNSARGTANRDIDQLLQGYGTPKELMVEQSVEDLGSTDAATKKNACEWLAKTPADPGTQDKPSRALEGLLKDQDKGVRLAAVKALEKWATGKSVLALTEALKDSALQEAALQTLLKIKEEQVIPVLAAHLGSRDRDRIAVALIEFGPKAERAVWLPLERGDVDTRRKAAEILSEIGTNDSVKILTRVATLEKNLRNLINQDAALTAVKKIRDRLAAKQPS